MSTLNNPDDQDATQALLLQSILQPDSKLSQVALRQTGLDVAMLETTYKEGVKPYLKYLHGYRPLLECDRSPIGRDHPTRYWHDKGWYELVVMEPWEHVLVRSGVDDPGVQVLRVVDVSLYAYGSTYEGRQHRKLVIFLTRKGQWVVWTNASHSASADYFSERVYRYDTVREMWEGVHQVVPDDYTIVYAYVEHNCAPATLALYIEAQLRRVLEETITIRQSSLDRMTHSLHEAEKRFGRVGANPR